MLAGGEMPAGRAQVVACNPPGFAGGTGLFSRNRHKSIVIDGRTAARRQLEIQAAANIQIRQNPRFVQQSAHQPLARREIRHDT